jgi:GTPase SAR1 family protein
MNQVIQIMGVSSSGKTTLLEQLETELVKLNKPVLIQKSTIKESLRVKGFKTQEEFVNLLNTDYDRYVEIQRELLNSYLTKLYMNLSTRPTLVITDRSVIDHYIYLWSEQKIFFGEKLARIADSINILKHIEQEYRTRVRIVYLDRCFDSMDKFRDQSYNLNLKFYYGNVFDKIKQSGLDSMVERGNSNKTVIKWITS